ncbi:MAG: RNB domain-containing ribonuclease, partial [Ruminococcus sp.]
PFVYRVHDAPSSEKIEALQDGLLRMGAEVPVLTNVQPRNLAEILEKAAGTPAAPVIHGMVLRSMAKAAYETEPIGHFGLALSDYAHFTSPIRRYPDLAIHRILSEWCSTHSAEAVQKRFTKFAAKAAEQSSQRELLTIRVSRDCEACYFAEYMRQHLGETMNGLITGVTDFGIYVMLPNTIEGMISIRDLGEETVWTNDHNVRLVQENGDRVYQLGDTISVRCTKTDISSGNIDFVLAETE